MNSQQVGVNLVSQSNKNKIGLKMLGEQKIFCALVTPFLEDSSIDWSGLGKILSLQNSYGNGILLFGSTGEGMSLARKEKIQILDFVFSNNINVPIVVNIESSHQEEVLSFIELMNNWPIDAMMAVVPPYMKPGIHGQIDWFSKILETSTKPIIIYNNPSRSCTALHPEVVSHFSKHPNFYGIKESTNSFSKMLEFVKAAPNKTILCGDDPNIINWSVGGQNGPIKGLMSVLANAWPNEMKDLVEKLLSNNSCPLGLDTDQLIAYDQLANSLFPATSSNPTVIKNYMFQKNLISTPVLRSPLSHKDFQQISFLDWEKRLGWDMLFKQ